MSPDMLKVLEPGNEVNLPVERLGKKREKQTKNGQTSKIKCSISHSTVNNFNKNKQLVTYFCRKFDDI